MNIFLDSGYLDFSKLYHDPSPFVFCVGARGTGKTYGGLQFCYQQGLKFIYLRSKDLIVKKLSTDMMNPFKPINDDLGIDVRINTKKTAGLPVFQETVDEKTRTIGYMLPLSTFSNFRGFDLSDIDLILYDEFIPEVSERPIKDQSDALFNMYETVNRNRELKGKDPVKLICISNSNSIFNDIFLSLRITRKVYEMVKKDKVYYRDPDRGLSIYNVIDSPISRKKQRTALYRLTEGSEFQEMAIENQYSIEYEDHIRSLNMTGFKPVCQVGELYIYNNADDIYYITPHARGVFTKIYGMKENELITFRHTNYSVWNAFLNNRLYFEDIYCLEVFNVIYL